MIAPSAFSCGGRERKYVRRSVVQDVDAWDRNGGTHHGAFDRAPDCCTFRTKRVTESELSGIGLLGLP